MYFIYARARSSVLCPITRISVDIAKPNTSTAGAYTRVHFSRAGRYRRNYNNY